MQLFRIFLLLLLSSLSYPSLSSTQLEPCMSAECVQMFKDFKKYARHYSPVAMEALGNFYMNGYGTEKNFARALKYYVRTGKYGSATAQYKAGLMYLYGIGKDENISLGISWLKSAVRNEYNPAIYYLGAMYIRGDKVEQDTEKAIHLLEVSANNGHAASQFLLAQIYEQDSFGIKDPSKAIALYSQSALKIEAAAQKLTDLNIPLPKQPAQDDGIEHIEVTPLPFLELMELKIAGLRNAPMPGFKLIISPGCKIAKRDCGEAGITDKSLIRHLWRNNVRRILE